MELGQCIEFFSRTPADGWAGGDTWVPEVAFGNLQVFDRFITERSFGQKKRIFTAPGERGIPSQYEVVRIGGRPYLVTADNLDVEGAVAYARTYLLQEATVQVSVIKKQVTPNASGMRGKVQETVSAPYYGDMERFAARASSEMPAVDYTTFSVWLPRSVDVTVDDELLIDGDRYDVREVVPLLLVHDIKAVKRGPST